MATIKDVAKLAGVSPSTVSRVIADSKLISIETKLRVKHAMDYLQYVPNAIARSLARKYTSTIAMSIINNPKLEMNGKFITEVMTGLNIVAHERNYNILLSISQNNEEEQQKCLKLIRERRIDGLILTSSPIIPSLLQELHKVKIPFVLIGEMDHPFVTSIYQDHYHAAYIATKHLIEQGYKNILFFGDVRDVAGWNKSINGYYEAMQKADLYTYTNNPEHYTVEAGFQSLEKTWNHKAFDAILTNYRPFVFSSLRFARSQSISIPEEMGLLGLYDSPMMTLTEPMITSVPLCGKEIGITAMDILLDSIDKSITIEQGNHRLTSKLLIRCSTQRCKGEDFTPSQI